MKKLLSLLMVLAMLLSFAACGQTGESVTTSPENAVPETTDAVRRYPITVTIEEELQRLISAYYITTSLLMALDLEVVDKLKQMLSNVYGAISLQACSTRCGRFHLVMLKENDL